MTDNILAKIYTKSFNTFKKLQKNAKFRPIKTRKRDVTNVHNLHHYISMK